MKKKYRVVFTSLFCLGLGSLIASGQGTFFYDQQSADETTGGGAGSAIQSGQPLGQSFTPSLNSVGFIRLYLYDGTPGNGQGATVYINLRENSITGPILGSTSPVFMDDRFGRGSPGYPDFFFSSAVPVIPGVTYFFQPVVQSGDTWGIGSYNTYQYPGGTAFYNGNASPGIDLWFREGIRIIVPEPSTWAMILLGSGFVFTARLFKRRRSKAGNEIE